MLPTMHPLDEQIDASRWTAGTLSVVLAADERRPDVAVLRAHGEIDLESAPMLREVLRPVLEHGTGPIVVDLSDVPFMDSTGMHVLVHTARRLESQNRSLAIACREGGQVHRLLAVIGLLDALTVHRSVESAVIGGDDLLRPDPGGNGGRSDARALTQSLLSAQQTQP